MKLNLLLVLICTMVLASCSSVDHSSKTPVRTSGLEVFEDFESSSYENWKIQGTAFGNAPHTGTSPKQLPVRGFLGKGLVNSYVPDDKPQGKMTSQTFVISHPYIAFLIGGGRHSGQTCMNLVIAGEIVKTQNGQNSETLLPVVWDVSDQLGKEARFEIVDRHSGAWGHINIDHIVFSPVYPELDMFLNYNPLVKAGTFERIYDPSVGENEKWYINDHCFFRGADGTWHLFGITHAEPAKPLDEKNFAHAISPELTANPWQKKPFILSAVKEKWNEEHLWAPHVIKHDNKYWMFYCAGDEDHTKYKIHLATSKDLNTWVRHPQNPMVVDGFDARDPFILKLGDEFIMYYTATDPPEKGHHIVAYRKSKDLVNWGEKNICFRDEEVGKWGGGTESPFVVRRGKYYYLFIGPRGGYVGTDVFRSENPFLWKLDDIVGHIESHALEVIRDTDGKWYASHCGWGRGGVYLAPLSWLDGLDDQDTSMSIP